MTSSDERWAEEGKPRAGPRCPPQFRDIVRRAGVQAAAGADAAWPAPAAQVHTGMKFRSQAWFSGDHQREPSRPAEPRQIASQSLAVRLAIVAQNDAAQSARQCGDGGARVGQPPSIGEQPQHGK